MARVRWYAPRVVHALAVLVTGLVLVSLLGAARDDAAIEARTGRATAEVLSVSISHTLVRFTTTDGEVWTPEQGIAYPAGLAPGQLVRVEYSVADPDLVRVAGRSWVTGLLPGGATVVVTWLLALGFVRWLRRPRSGSPRDRSDPFVAER